jgi:hypothetical protein
MALPNTIRVKLISDEAGSITITPVVVQEMPLRELLERVLAHCGKDAKRVARLLERGTLVQGASRFTWEGFTAQEEDLAETLAMFPDPEPDRPCDPDRCVLVVLHFTQGGAAEVEPQPLRKKRLLQGKAFWDVLLATLQELCVAYAGYSYRESADKYRLDLPTREAGRLQQAGGLLAYSSLSHRIKTVPLSAIDFYTARD